MNFGQKIRDLREDKDMSQAQVAALIPMNQSNYSKIERDLQEPNLYQLKRLAEIFCVSADSLLGLDSKSAERDREFGRRVIQLYENMNDPKKHRN